MVTIPESIPISPHTMLVHGDHLQDAGNARIAFDDLGTQFFYSSSDRNERERHVSLEQSLQGGTHFDIGGILNKKQIKQTQLLPQKMQRKTL